MYPLVNIHHGISAAVDSGSQKHAVGDRIVYGDAQYVFMYNGSNSHISAGKLVELISGASGYSVVVSGTSASKPMGICVHESATTGQYFWGLVGGVCPKVANTTPTATSQAWLYPQTLGQLGITAPTGFGTAGIQGPHAGALGKAIEEINAASTGRAYIFPLS